MKLKNKLKITSFILFLHIVGIPILFGQNKNKNIDYCDLLAQILQDERVQESFAFEKYDSIYIFEVLRPQTDSVRYFADCDLSFFHNGNSAYLTEINFPDDGGRYINGHRVLGGKRLVFQIIYGTPRIKEYSKGIPISFGHDPFGKYEAIFFKKKKGKYIPISTGVY